MPRYQSVAKIYSTMPPETHLNTAQVWSMNVNASFAVAIIHFGPAMHEVAAQLCFQAT